jgi:L-asparaginase / beta-aspartyl-peptidase
MPSASEPRLERRRLIGWFAAGVTASATAVGSAPHPARAQTGSGGPGWDRFDTGPADARRRRLPEPGLLLMGGAGGNDEAFRWLAERSGSGRLLILASRGGPWRAERLMQLGAGFAAITTAVTHERSASSDPGLVDLVSRCDAVLMSGGAQSVYLERWRNSPLQAALQQHVDRGKPLAGLSAGLAMMGEWCFTAEYGSRSSRQVLADPFSPSIALEPGLLRLAPLAGMLTDSHFSERQRLGRLAGFLVRLHCDGHARAIGLGIDERTSLALSDGEALVFSDDGGSVHRVSVEVDRALCAARQGPLTDLRAQVRSAGAGERFAWPWEGRRGESVTL